MGWGGQADVADLAAVATVWCVLDLEANLVAVGRGGTRRPHCVEALRLLPGYSPPIVNRSMLMVEESTVASRSRRCHDHVDVHAAVVDGKTCGSASRVARPTGPMASRSCVAWLIRRSIRANFPDLPRYGGRFRSSRHHAAGAQARGLSPPQQALRVVIEFTRRSKDAPPPPAPPVSG